MKTDSKDEALSYLFTHVFCPLRLPDGNDHSLSSDIALCEAVYNSACAYSQHINTSIKSHWERVIEMLSKLSHAMATEVLDEALVVSQVQSLKEGDFVAYLIRAQNAAIIFRREKSATLVEMFEVSPCSKAILATRGKLVCSYPGPAITVPNDIIDNETFLSEMANFLSRMNVDVLDTTGHPRYITELLTGILRGIGRPASVQRISKRIGDDAILGQKAKVPWRRSPLWLVIRVTLQTTLQRYDLGRGVYKDFILFFMNELAHTVLCHCMSNDVLHWASAKVSRRLTKLGDSAPAWLSEAVLETCTGIRTLLDERWKQVQEADAISPPWDPCTLDFSADTKLSLSNSSEYISNALIPIGDCPPSLPAFEPKARLRGRLDDFLSKDGGFFQDAYRAEPHLALYDVEREVSRGIDAWVDHALTDDVACEKLELLMANYSLAARNTYGKNPEDLSRMLLTMIDLWVALDKLVVDRIPILAEYFPEILVSNLERLLMRDVRDLQRLLCAVKYIRHRHSNAIAGQSVFSDHVDSSSFAVRYFEHSADLHCLRDRIVDAATAERQAKLTELRQLNQSYSKNIKSSTAGNPPSTTITVHKWPLPTDSYQIAVVIFELHCPTSFNMWRSATFHLLVDILPLLPGTEPFVMLQNHSSLSPYYQGHPRSRIALELILQSHPGITTLPSVEDKVCVNSICGFYYRDVQTRLRVSHVLATPDISTLCSYQLPQGPYSNLQPYLQHTTHTSNDVLCNQTGCQEGLSIHESIAFGHLRSEPSLQWFNILREIRVNTLTFRHKEVHLLVAQAALQVGPVSETEVYVWHEELGNLSFCSSILRELENLVSTIQGNWLEAMTMNTISVLVARVLAAGIDDIGVTRQARQLLFMICKETFAWVVDIANSLENITGKIKKEACRARLRDMAAICRSAFDVGLDDAKEMLGYPEALGMFLTCAVIVRQNTPTSLDILDEMSRLLLERDRRLSWKLERVTSSLVLSGNKGIDFAVKRVYPTYNGAAHWHRGVSEHCSWFISHYSGCEATRLPKITFDIIDGTLLLDRKSEVNLPQWVKEDSVFGLIFGDRDLDVMLSDVAGMEYASHDLISGHRVYFRTVDRKLVIRAREQRLSDFLELVPPQKLEYDLPAVLIEKHAHWLNLSTKTIEVRPLEKLWQSSEDNWRIHFAPGSHCAQKGHTRLFDIRSPTWDMVARLLAPMDAARNLVITQDDCTRTVSVHLPRYSLSFFINSNWELEAYVPQGMVYDKNQCIGTLFGLVNKLVLRPKTGFMASYTQRQVLIPEGNVSYKQVCQHVRVKVHTNDQSYEHMPYQTFRINTDLGVLAGNGSLESHFYRAYLHALCSNPSSVDPLTGRTGTEEALMILRSAASRSFMKIDARAAKVLGVVASLSTEYLYEEPAQRIQSARWVSLPVAAQHHGLYLSCASIRDFHKCLQIFHSGSSLTVFDGFPLRNDHLLRRAALRAALIYPFEFSDLPQTKGYGDTVYLARDILRHAAGEHRARSIAVAVYGWTPYKPAVENVDSLLEYESWLRGPIGREGPVSLRYSKAWLFPDLLAIGNSLYQACRRCQKTQHHFQLVFSLPAMAFRSGHMEKIALIFLAFAVVSHEFDGVELPGAGERNASYKDRQSLISKIRSVLDQKASLQSSPYSFTPSSNYYCAARPEIPLLDLFRKRGRTPRVFKGQRLSQQATGAVSIGNGFDGSAKLGQLIDILYQNKEVSSLGNYVGELRRSGNSLNNGNTSYSRGINYSVESFIAEYDTSKLAYFEEWENLASSLAPQTLTERVISASGQWPRITRTAVLGCLASTSPITVPDNWRECLISFAERGLEYQRSRRLLAIFNEAPKESQKEVQDLYNEIANTGFCGCPDWLLMQLEGDFLIRPIQADVAFKMINPQPEKNTTLQLLMGEGKSSVIIPMVVSALADGERLVRVVVPRALSTQMFHTLVRRLAGFANRRIYFLPFSRSLQMGQSDARAINAILKECMHERGVLLAQPDHILSFKLLSVEKQLSGNDCVGDELLRTQQWLYDVARDIIDECDEIFHTRNELIYAIDTPRALEGFPERWTTTQQVLRLVRSHAASLLEGLEYESRPHGAFPYIRICHRDAGKALESMIAQDVVDSLLSKFVSRKAHDNVQQAIHKFITNWDVTASDVQIVRNYAGGNVSTWKVLLHLRGLLVSGILIFALQLRWRVAFGLAPSRTMLAVPYRAKDVPAPRAEFGHPDTAVVLTCLSYYYTGLSEQQLMVCFERLLLLDNPDAAYGLWLIDWPTVPHSLTCLRGINLHSSEQWKRDLFPNLSHNQATIDFYLSEIVFRNEAKEFPYKLSCSSWDLAEQRRNVTTGFSGTKDACYLLPISTAHQVPDHQQGSNAIVLSYLLQPENDAYMLIMGEGGKHRIAEEFLALVVQQDPEIRVIVDAGAQVLELANREFAEDWLRLKPDASAAIYFNQEDELMVLTREGREQLLLESSLFSRLDECLVYLDDAHTRGTDIKLPIGFRAAITLGPNITKDRLTQACMRMRKLGHGHTIMFFAPLEVDLSIRKVASRGVHDQIHITDVLHWAILETCKELRHHAPRWAQQGVDHTGRHDAWKKFSDRECTARELASAWRQPGSKTLEDLYAPACPSTFSNTNISDTSDVKHIIQRCRFLGVQISLPITDAVHEEREQVREREVAYEINYEHVESSPKAIPSVPFVDEDVRRFVQNGKVVLQHQSEAFLPLCMYFGRSSTCHEPAVWTKDILMTVDFCRVTWKEKTSEKYHRPVNWILSDQSPGGPPTLVILSPFEVSALLPEIKRSKYVHLHVYAPRVQQARRSCDDLCFYTIPPIPCDWSAPTQIIDQLNIFSGQLYLSDKSTYLRLCCFLSVYAPDLQDERDLEVQSDGFIKPVHLIRTSRPMSQALNFRESPLTFIKEHITHCRMGVPFTLSHMGKILDGHLLQDEDFDQHYI